MSLEEQKIEVARLVFDIQNANLIKEIKAFITQRTDVADFWDELPSDIQDQVDKAAKDVKSGNFLTHSEVVNKHAKWLKK